MAWNARWTLSFDSRTGKQCVVTISEQEYVGNVTALTGGAVPFETQEDDDDDIFMPIRGQSGYIRIVTDDSTLLDSIVPPNELAHLVTLTVDGVVKWRGFQETEMFEQEWHEGNHEVELPVRSLLASLESTHLGNDKRYGLHSLGELFYDLFNSFGIADLMFRCVWNIYALPYYFSLRLYSGIFFSESSQEGEPLDDRMYSDSGSDIAEALCMTFGIQLRESQGNIYFVQHGEWSTMSEAFSLTEMKDAKNKDYINTAGTTLAEWIEQWRGTDNQESRLKPYRGIDITLDISKNDDTIDILRFPDIEEEDKPVYDLTLSGGTLHAQPYPQTLEEELGNPKVQGYLYKWHNPYDTLPEYVGYVRCAETIEHAPWRELFDGTSTSGSSDEPINLYVGAIPCRWSFDSGLSGTASISTTEGYYMAFVPCIKIRMYRYSPRQMFVYGNYESVTLDSGYLSIDFNLLMIQEGTYGVGQEEEESASTWTSILALGSALPLQIGLVVKVGDKYWNGSAWQTQQYFFYVDVENGAIKSNYSSSMGIAQTSGYLIPVSNMTGEVTVSIMDHIVVGDYINFYPIGRAYFMSNFAVKHHKPSDATSLLSDRSKNIYKSLTTARGYNDVKDVTLKVGTNNYNRDSNSFLRDKQGAYIELMRYWFGRGGKRPEEELLERMKRYYSVSRKTYRATVEVKPIMSDTRERGLPEIFTNIGNSTFIAVDADHDWREDTQKIKFIELHKNII